MQSDNNQLYKITSEKTKKSEAVYKDIGNFVFKALSVELRNPKSLILKLKGVGTWYLRRQRMQIHIQNVNPGEGTADYDEKEALKTIFAERLKEYDQYIQERTEVRNERYKTQPLLEPPKRED